LTNVLILYTAALLRTHRAFATTFEAIEAPFFQWEKVLQLPGRGHTINEPDLVPEEFVVEENVNYWKDVSARGSQCGQQDGKESKLTITSSRRGTIEGHPIRATYL
jgi:hypothetical protein